MGGGLTLSDCTSLDNLTWTVSSGIESILLEIVNFSSNTYFRIQNPASLCYSFYGEVSIFCTTQPLCNVLYLTYLNPIFGL